MGAHEKPLETLTFLDVVNSETTAKAAIKNSLITHNTTAIPINSTQKSLKKKSITLFPLRPSHYIYRAADSKTGITTNH